MDRPTPPRTSDHLCLRGEVDGDLRAYPLQAGENLVGSSRGAAVRLEAPSISRRHASVRLEGGAARLEDLGSKNGTFLNGRPIRESVLEIGDELRFGPVHLRLETMDPGDGVLGLELGGDEASTASLAEPSTLLSRYGGAPQRRHFELVDAFFDRLTAAPEPDWAGALQRLATAFGARGAALVLWRPQTIVLAAAGDASQMPPASWLPETGATSLLFVPGEPGGGAAEDDTPAWTGAVAPTLDEPLGLLVRGPFPEQQTSGPILLTLLRLCLHFHQARLAPAGDEKPEAPPGLDFPPGILPGSSPAMLELYRQMTPLVRGDLPVLLRGETGVGKEHLAATLHRSSARRDGPFVAINCAAIPSELLEAELFGIGKGIATGVKARRGRFLDADGGTLFLDEIGDMSADLQAKLLRALQEKEIHPLGLAPVKVDVRTIAATNSDLPKKITCGDFRADLYYRLAGVELRIPPLRERREDLPRLIAHFVRRFSTEAATRVRGLTVKALDELTACAWPGNVRQLEHEMRRLVYLCPPGQAITSEMLSPALGGSENENAEPGLDVAGLGGAGLGGPGLGGAELGGDLALEPRLERLERLMISEALRRTAGNQTRAAKLLGVSRNGLAYRLDRLGLDAGDFSP